MLVRSEVEARETRPDIRRAKCISHIYARTLTTLSPGKQKGTTQNDGVDFGSQPH